MAKVIEKLSRFVSFCGFARKFLDDVPLHREKNRKLHNAMSLEEDGNSLVGEQKVLYRESFQASRPQLVLVKAQKVLR